MAPKISPFVPFLFAEVGDVSVLAGDICMVIRFVKLEVILHSQVIDASPYLRAVVPKR